MPVKVKAVDENARIVVEWSAYGAPTPIEWIFTPRPDGTTFVSVTNTGFPGGEVEAVQQALEATQGFAFVLAGAKAFLEHNIQLNLVPDRFPDGLPDEVTEPADVGSEKSPDTPGSAENAAQLPHSPEDWPRVFERHLNAGDLDAVLELYESEARLVSPSGEMILGRNRIREVITGLVQSKTKMTSRVVKAITLDNVTLLYTDFQETTVDDSGETIELRSKAIELLRRQPDGTWKLFVGDPNARGGTVC